MKWINVFAVIQFAAMMTLELHVSAQSNFQKGIYVTEKSDTIRGFIDQREWLRNPTSFVFKATLDQNEITLGLSSARYFEVNNFEFYQRYFVSISMNESQLGKVGSQIPSKNDTVFLRILEAGQNCSLFSYRDDLKQRLYLRESSDETPYELINTVETTPDGTKLLVEKFKRQLFTFAAKIGKLTPEIERAIKNVSYAPGSIISVVYLINGKKANPIKTKLAKGNSVVKNRGFSFYLGSGLSKSDLIYSSGPQWSKNSKSSYNPYFNIGIKYFPNSMVRKFFLNSEISMSFANFSTDANNLTSYHPEQVNYTFNQKNMSLYLGLNYNIYSTVKLSWFAGCGFRVNHGSYGNNLYTITDTYLNPTTVNTNKVPNFFDLSPNYYSFSVRTGATFYKRFETLVDFNFPMAINRYTALWTEKIVVGRFVVNYILTKPKSPK